MKPRLIAAVSITSLLLGRRACVSRKANCRVPDSCRRPAARRRRRSAASRAAAAATAAAAAAGRGQALQAGGDHRARGRSTDPSFEAFRKQLGAIAEKKDRKALAGLVAQNFFWMGEKGDKADKKKPGIDNLAKAIQLDGKEAPGWEMLGAACRRSDRHAVSGPQGHDLRAGRSDLQRAGARGARQGDRHRGRRLGLSDPDRPRGARRRRSPTRRWSRSSACTSCA